MNLLIPVIIPILKKDFCLEKLDSLLNGWTTNHNESSNFVRKKFINKEIRHDNPEKYDQQKYLGISQFNQPYTHYADKTNMLNLEVTDAQNKVINQRVHRHENNQQYRQRPDFVDTRIKKKRRLLQQKKDDKLAKYKKGVAICEK